MRQRVSRLLVVASDGSPRFFRQVEQLRTEHAPRLEVLLLECDAPTLGAQLFGRGREARAVLIDHKDAVARFLAVLERQLEPGPGAEPT